MGLYPTRRSSQKHVWMEDVSAAKVIAVRHECELGDSCGARVGSTVGPASPHSSVTPLLPRPALSFIVLREQGG